MAIRRSARRSASDLAIRARIDDTIARAHASVRATRDQLAKSHDLNRAQRASLDENRRDRVWREKLRPSKANPFSTFGSRTRRLSEVFEKV